VEGEQELIEQEQGNLLKVVNVVVPKYTPIKSTRGKIGRLLRGDIVRVGRYDLNLHYGKDYTAIKIKPVKTKTRTFWQFDGSPLIISERINTPRVKVETSYFLWELVKGKHLDNKLLSKQVINLLDRLKEVLT